MGDHGLGVLVETLPEARRRQKIPQASHFAGQRMPRRKGPALARSACRELAVDGLEARKGRAMARELERQPTPALDDAGRHVVDVEGHVFALLGRKARLVSEDDRRDGRLRCGDEGSKAIAAMMPTPSPSST